MRFFDAHCDTIGEIWEHGADFVESSDLDVTLPGLREADVCAQVFASWVWTPKFRGNELEVGLAKVEAVRKLCNDHSEELVFARTALEVREACDGGTRTAVIASLEGADPLQGDVDNLALFHHAGVRLLTLAWGDNAFCGTVYGEGGGLTVDGFDLVQACEEQGILIDVSHASDRAFADVCRVAKKPFVASHSNCRALCPSPRNLTDDMIRALGERGGVIGMALAPSFLSTEYYEQTKDAGAEFFRAVAEGMTVDEAGDRNTAAIAGTALPRFELIADHVRRAINAGGEDVVGLGGDLDGIDSLPAGLHGVGDYPLIADLLERSALTPGQVEKVCYRNLARVFRDTVT